MPIKYITKWNNYRFDEIIDVRSEAEYKEDHLPLAINLPVLNNKQRIEIGTIYKKSSPFKAKKLGASYISENISKYLKNYLINKPGNWKPLIYCWRGGQRSKAFSIILSEVGWRTYQLNGGYREYRNKVIDFFEKIGPKLKIILISGKTGSAKTKILQSIDKFGGQILDLEGIANHKGSLLGKIPGLEQPSQKLFESKLYYELKQLNLRKSIYVEAESSKIGNIHIPKSVWAKMIISPRVEIEADIKLRAKFLVKDYYYMCKNPDLIYPLLNGLKKRLSKNLIDSWKDLILKKKWIELTQSFLENHYDPSYSSNTIKNDRKIKKLLNVKSLSDKEIRKIAKVILKNN